MVNNLVCRSFWLFAIFISGGGLHTDALGVASKPPDILAATQPLQREIESLKEKLELLEAKHDTLEAATEQFRLKAKTLKEKLESERTSFDTLMVSKASLEEEHETELSKLRQALEEAEKRAVSTQLWLESRLGNEKDAEERYQDEVNRRIFEVEHHQSEIEQSLKEKEQLQSLLHERDEELTESKATYLKLRQELFVANEQLGELEQQSKLTLWSVYMQRIKESEVTATGIDLLQEYWEWLKEDILPGFRNSALVLYSTVHKKSVVAMEKTSEHMTEKSDSFQQQKASMSSLMKSIIAGTSAFAQGITGQINNIKSSVLLQDIAHQLYNRINKSVLSLWSKLCGGPMEHYTQTLTSLHDAAVFCFEWAIAVATSYFIVEMNGTRESWVYNGCFVLKAYSHSIVLFMEVILGLLTVDFALTTLMTCSISWFRDERSPGFGRVPSMPMKGTRPSASLLRTAGGLPRRQQ